MISVGKGTNVGSYPMLMYTDTTTPYQINSLGLQSNEWASWEFTDKPREIPMFPIIFTTVSFLLNKKSTGLFSDGK